MYYPEATCSQISGWDPLTNFTSCDPRPIHAPSIFLIPYIVEKGTVNGQKFDDGKAWELFKAENTSLSALRVYALSEEASNFYLKPTAQKSSEDKYFYIVTDPEDIPKGLGTRLVVQNRKYMTQCTQSLCTFICLHFHLFTLHVCTVIFYRSKVMFQLPLYHCDIEALLRADRS